MQVKWQALSTYPIPTNIGGERQIFMDKRNIFTICKLRDYHRFDIAHASNFDI